MKRLLSALALLGALGAHADPSPWFDAGISGYASWPSDGSDKVVEGQGTWTGTAGATLDAGRHVLQIQAPGDPVAFTPVANGDMSTDLLVFQTTNVLTKIQSLGSLGTLDPSAKGSIAAAYDGATTNYYGWLKDPNGATNAWFALSGATPAIGVSFEASLVATTGENGELFVLYQVDGTALSAGFVSADTWSPDFGSPFDGQTFHRVATQTAGASISHAGMHGRHLEVASLSASTISKTAEPIVPVELTLAAPPANVSVVSVTTNGVSITPAGGVYTVDDGASVIVSFAPAEGYRLVGSSTVTVVMDGDTELATADMPTAELIPMVTLTFPELPANVSIASVTVDGVAVEPVNGAYTVPEGTDVTVAFAAAEGYVLAGGATATLTLDADTEFPSASLPAAVTPASLVSINEIMASNPSVDKGGITNAMGIAEMDWIELYNAGPAAVDATGWFLTDNDKKGKETKATILGSCVIPAGGYKIVWLDKIHIDPAEYGADEAFAVIKLSSGGDLIKLSDAGTNFVDKIDFTTKPQIKGYSYGPGMVSYGPIAGHGPYVYMKTATPGAPNVTEGWGDFTPAVTFSEPHGWKTEAFDLTLSCSDTNATIYYTLDGTSPTTASILYTNAIPITKTTIIRAAVPIVGSVLQFDTSATYLYLDEVLAQERSTTAPAGTVGFPNNSSKQAMLYGMLQLSGADRERMLTGFTNSIPTISVVTDPGNLFNSSTGIYVNAKGEGVEWERPIMLEQFDPTGVGADFAQPAGIRIRGGNSRQPSWAKHAIRFFFRSSYGESSLAQKMFPGELPKEAGEYDKLDLRCSQNFSWANAKSTMDTFVTEVFARDSQRDMGQPYTRSRYCHLFLNGQYWGLYQTQERGDEHWGESYLGGDSLQYDVIKASSSWSTGRLGYSIECNEGTWDAWSNLWEIATTQGFANEYTNNYYRILGLNPDGTRNPAYPILLNVESLRAFMFSTHFMVDKDGPTSPYSSIDKGHANNFNAVRNRNDAGDVSGFVFLRHDAEVSMGMEDKVKADKNPTYWGTENQTDPAVGSPDPTGLGAAKFRTIPYFTPAELHYLLMQNPTYKREYADAFYRFFLKEGGAMTVENATARYASRMAEIDNAIVCEQARWAQNGQTRTTWLNACNTATNFIAQRVGYMKSQYQAAGWYPSIEPPVATNAAGTVLADGNMLDWDDAAGASEKVFLSAAAGAQIYYTTNRSDLAVLDPCTAGGEPSADAVLYDGTGFALGEAGAKICARVRSGDEWSPMMELTLEVDCPTDQKLYIRVAEIMSAPEGDADGDGEFITLTNLNASAAVSLQGIVVKSAKSTKTAELLFTITNDLELAAGASIRLGRPDYWPTGSMKNKDVSVEVYDKNGKLAERAVVDADLWFDGNVGVCKGTGRWFIALEFGALVDQQSQWMPSPEPGPAVPLPEDPTARAAVLALMENDARIEPWLVEIGQTASGLAAITGFTGSAEAMATCYLVGIDPEDDPEVELTIPTISFDAAGNVLVGGSLLIHGTEATRSVNGAVRLYYANTLEALPASTNYVPVTPPAFPVVDKKAVDAADAPDARFFRMKIE